MNKPRMCKRHYNLLIDAIRNCEYKNYDYLIESIANGLVGTNPKFDPEYFINKCYGDLDWQNEA